MLLRAFEGDLVQDPGLGADDELLVLTPADMADHPGRGEDLVGCIDHLGPAFGMDEHFCTGVAAPRPLDVLPGEPFMHEAEPVPREDLLGGEPGDVPCKIPVRHHDHLVL